MGAMRAELGKATGKPNGSPVYDTTRGGHYGASSTLAARGHAPPQAHFENPPWNNVSQGLTGNDRDTMNTYWQHQIAKLENDQHDYKLHHLPLARIKKVMKADPDVKMISAEAPILFAKGCDIFITELTMRAWIHAEENKRRTLQRSDIASALTKSDMFDFLIDIVPRDDPAAQSHKRSVDSGSVAGAAGSAQPQVNIQDPSQLAEASPSQQQQQQQQQQQRQPGYHHFSPTGMGPAPPPAQDFRAQGMPPQMPAEAMYQQAPAGMYQGQATQNAFQQPPSMFDPGMYSGSYGGYTRQPMYPQNQQSYPASAVMPESGQQSTMIKDEQPQQQLGPAGEDAEIGRH